jgi:hypothetical protein
MVKVLALPGNCAMQTCNTLVGGTPATRELVLAVSGSICGLERLFILPQEVRILNRLRPPSSVAMVAKVSIPQSKARLADPQARCGRQARVIEAYHLL